MTAKSKVVALEHVVIRFSGDSGDGMQLTGNLFSDSTAFAGNDFATFPDYPAEIRPPQGTVAGVRKAPWLASLASKCTLDTNPFTPLATSATSSWP